MKIRFFTVLLLLFSLTFGLNSFVFAQSRPQRPDQTTGDGKKNKRPTAEEIEEQRKKAEEEERRRKEEADAVIDDEVLKINTQIVNVDAVVFNKKNKQIITGLKKENFAIFENGKKVEISNFAEPESPITVTLLVEFSRWSEIFGYYGSGGWDRNGTAEVIRPVAYFLSRFIKAPDDYASVIAFDMRPTPITDFTNDPNRLRATVDLLLKNRPAFRENNLFDAIKFALVGGKGDSVVLENSEARTIEYGGMVDVKAKRRAIILVASGIDTFSKSNYERGSQNHPKRRNSDLYHQHRKSFF